MAYKYDLKVPEEYRAMLWGIIEGFRKPDRRSEDGYGWDIGHDGSLAVFIARGKVVIRSWWIGGVRNDWKCAIADPEVVDKTRAELKERSGGEI